MLTTGANPFEFSVSCEVFGLLRPELGPPRYEHRLVTLAATGILDGRPAATHWMYVEEMRRRYPTVQVDGDVLYVDDGEVLTSAGTAAASGSSRERRRCYDSRQLNP